MAWDRTIKRLMLALALTCAAGWLFKSHCTPGGWTMSEQYSTGCYSDAVPFWDGRGVSAGALPYFDARMEYPVLTGGLIWVEGQVTRLLFGARANAAHFLFVVTLVNALIAALLLFWFRREGMDDRRLWAWALAPPLFLYVGHNWDLLAIGFAVGAMLLARRKALPEAAAVAGLGLAAKLYPVLMLPLIGLGALFRSNTGWVRRLRDAVLVTIAAVGAWAAVNLPVIAGAFDNWTEFYIFSQQRSGTAASIWEIMGVQGWWATTIQERNLYAAVAFLIGAAAIIGFGWRRHRDRLWIVFTPLLAWFMLTNKVYSPQFDLWLYPMLLMTAPRLRAVGIFVAAGIAAYFAEFWWFASTEQAWPYFVVPGHIAIAAGVRAAAMIWLIVEMVRLPPPQWILLKPAAEAAR